MVAGDTPKSSGGNSGGRGNGGCGNSGGGDSVNIGSGNK